MFVFDKVQGLMSKQVPISLPTNIRRNLCPSLAFVVFVNIGKEYIFTPYRKIVFSSQCAEPIHGNPRVVCTLCGGWVPGNDRAMLPAPMVFVLAAFAAAQIPLTHSASSGQALISPPRGRGTGIEGRGRGRGRCTSPTPRLKT